MTHSFQHINPPPAPQPDLKLAIQIALHASDKVREMAWPQNREAWHDATAAFHYLEEALKRIDNRSPKENAQLPS